MLFLLLEKAFSFQFWREELKTKNPGSENLDGRSCYKELGYVQPKYIRDTWIVFPSKHIQA